MGINGGFQRGRNETTSVHISTSCCTQFHSIFADHIFCVSRKTTNSNIRVDVGVGLSISNSVGLSISVLSLWWCWRLNPGKHWTADSALTFKIHLTVRKCSNLMIWIIGRLLCWTGRSFCGSNRPMYLLKLVVHMFMCIDAIVNVWSSKDNVQALALSSTSSGSETWWQKPYPAELPCHIDFYKDTSDIRH